MKTILLSIFIICFFKIVAQDTDSAALEQERITWNRRLTKDTAFRFNKQPNALLVEIAGHRTPGAALDVGMGQGRNSIYLAKHGWKVTGIDIADEAVKVALGEAKRQHLKIEAVLASIDNYDFGKDRWDLVVFVYEGCIDEGEERLNKIEKSMKSGAVIVFEFFHREAGIKMNRPDFGCETNTIRRAFEKEGAFKILRFEEKSGIADYSLKEYKLVRLVAEKR